jgi:pimeloyl-ACP methyl ester carboxylesterase
MAIIMPMGTSLVIAALLAQGVAPPDPPPLGKLVDIGGYRIHLNCTGKGKQTVILSPGAGDFSFVWSLVQTKVSGFARVCSYDRAGTAWSDPGPVPRTMRQEAYEVRSALHAAKERGPYTLLGHSLGGLVMRVFADRYPDETAALVLVDATSPDTTLSLNGKLVRMRELAQDRPLPEVQTMQTGPPRRLSDDELKQSVNSNKKSGEAKIGPPYDQLPAGMQPLQLWASSQPSRVAPADNYLAEELKRMYEQTQAVPHPLGSKPLVTIVAMRADPPPPGVTRERWAELVKEKVEQKRGYAGLSTNSKVVLAAKAGHHVHLDDPDTVVSAVRDVDLSLRRHTELASSK